MKILVTGTAGFIGFHLVQKLIREGHEIIGIDNINDYYDVNLKYARLAETGIYSTDDAVKTKKGKQDYTPIAFNKLIQSVLHPNYSFVRLNLEDKECIQKLFEDHQFEQVIHLAAQAGVRHSINNPELYIQSNIVGFFNIIDACRRTEVKKLIYASSSSVYGANSKIPFSEEDQIDTPVSLYAATKKSNELIAHAYSHLYNLPCIGLRFFTVYGPWGRPDMAPMLFANAIRHDQLINIFNNGKMERDFTYIKDIVEGISKVLHCPLENLNLYQILNIGHGSPIQLMNFINLLEQSMEKTVAKKYLPMQDGEVYKTWANTYKLEQFTKHNSQIKLEEGIVNFVEWFKNYYK